MKANENSPNPTSIKKWVDLIIAVLSAVAGFLSGLGADLCNQLIK